MKWKLHAAYTPQSSGKVEHVNWTLKTTLVKLCQKTNLSWVNTLLLALLRARCTLRYSGYSPFEILYERPPTVTEKLKGDHQQLADLEMSQHLQALGEVFHQIARETLERTPIPLGNWVHPYQQEMRYGLKIGSRNHFSQFGQALTWLSWQPLLLLKL